MNEELEGLVKVVEEETGVHFWEGGIPQVDDRCDVVTGGYVGEIKADGHDYKVCIVESHPMGIRPAMYQFFIVEYPGPRIVFESKRSDMPERIAQIAVDEIKAAGKQLDFEIRESRTHRRSGLVESFLGNREKGGFDSAKVVRNLKDGKYDPENVIVACVSALEGKQKSALALKLVKQLQSDGILAKVFKKSGEFGTKEQ